MLKLAIWNRYTSCGYRKCTISYFRFVNVGSACSRGSFAAAIPGGHSAPDAGFSTNHFPFDGHYINLVMSKSLTVLLHPSVESCLDHVEVLVSQHELLGADGFKYLIRTLQERLGDTDEEFELYFYPDGDLLNHESLVTAVNEEVKREGALHLQHKQGKVTNANEEQSIRVSTQMLVWI